MIRSTGAAGFGGCASSVASTRLIDAVAASLAIASMSLCLIVALTVLSSKVSMAMPFPS
jgi:galactokinase